ncbi:phosphotransferase [Rhizomonospora bruguierae]|uniref:phosphotransferase n=1 Tax=Rhizomonospora bruguierae TaxID=1581705 RepID=UPI001BCB523B|nr:phosphotransferase [Micromonospora sp. NBRC 107566]
MARGTVDVADLGGLVREAFGAGRRAETVERLRGGTAKGVYRVRLDDGGTAILYAWGAAESYWPGAGNEDPALPFSGASSLDLFVAGRAALDSAGVRTPRVYAADRERSLALVEDVRGGTLEALLERGRHPALDGLAAALAAMRQHRSGRLGRPSYPAGPAASCAQIILERALRQLGEAARRVERIHAVRERVVDTLHALADDIQPRDRYGLVHGELGPDHVLIDAATQEPVLIDLDGVLFFDVEWEHAFLELRFGDHYPTLRLPGLDEARLRLYRLAQAVSLVAGPLQLLDGDFPDRAFMLQVVEWNIARVLGLSDGVQGQIPAGRRAGPGPTR